MCVCLRVRVCMRACMHGYASHVHKMVEALTSISSHSPEPMVVGVAVRSPPSRELVDNTLL